MSERKTLFTAVLQKSKDQRGFYFEDVRTRSGDIVSKYIIPQLSIDDIDKIIDLKPGCFMAFLANVDFKNIELI